MTLAEEYARQAAWRSPGPVLDALPPLAGATVLDLGCGVGDGAAALAARGARVVGVDASDELLAAARARGIEGARFVARDLRGELDGLGPADGLWVGFALAYFTDAAAALARWARALRPGGWLALIEVDDLFAHEPLEARTRASLESYVRAGLAAGRYDFRAGRGLRAAAERAGLDPRTELLLEDAELAFQGPAAPGVAAAWRARFERLRLLRDHCGADFERVRDDFLACLARPEHRSSARVVACVATRPEGG